MWRAVDGAERQLTGVAKTVESRLGTVQDAAAGQQLLTHLRDATSELGALREALPKRAPRAGIDGRPHIAGLAAVADAIEGASGVVARSSEIRVPTLPPTSSAPPPIRRISGASDAETALRRLRTDDGVRHSLDVRPRIAETLRDVVGGRAMQRLLRVRVIGAEHVPREGGVVLATTHTGAADQATTLLGHTRTPRIMAHAGLMKHPVLRRVLEQAGAFPVEPGNARTAIRTTEAHLLDGNAVKIYAEGMQVRVDRLAPAREGAALAAIRTGKPVVVQGEYGTRPARQYGESVLRHWTHREGRGAVAWSEPIPTAHLDPTNRDHVTALAARIGDEQARLREVARAAVRH
jgi:1-acyl-sn-glycerol-3-phosphate acyltransferase